ncbi:MAG: arginase family protein [Candidatus Aminicenantes bacterium]
MNFRTKAFTIIILMAVFTIFGLTMIEDKGPVKLAVVLQPISGSRSGPEISSGPQLMYEGIHEILADLGIEEVAKEIIILTPEEEKDYGAWHRVGLANGHLNKTVARLSKEGLFPLGLLSNCNSLTGMLGGMQNSGPGRHPLSVGLIWLDAHADYNTPETTLSGMLGGMPVAVAAGKCLFRLRLKAGLDPAIPEKNIIMMGVRDMDPLEEELVLNSHITLISTEEMVALSPRMKEEYTKLCDRVDVVYIHIDLDVLDAPDIPGHTFQIPNGPNPTQLGKALQYMMQNPKVGALGIASFPTQEEVRAKSLGSTLEVIKGGLLGLQER